MWSCGFGASLVRAGASILDFRFAFVEFSIWGKRLDERIVPEVVLGRFGGKT